MRTEFVAVDGEAIDGKYALLMSSTSKRAFDAGPEGLDTRTCLEFLLDLRKKGRTLVCFGLGYDANNWLRELGPKYLETIWKNNVVYWRGYRLEWLPGRWFSVKHHDGRRVKVCEVFGYFQSSFIRALADWGMETPKEIDVGKAARGTFTRAQLAKIESYCLKECHLLVTLMDTLADAMTEAEIPHPASGGWIGAGSIAGSLLKSQGMKAHHAHDLELCGDDVNLANDVVLAAYFGGRIELLRQGVTNSGLRSFDIRSAYPHAATLLPSLTGATLEHRREYDPSATHAIWRCHWETLPGQLMPFPARKSKSIYYPPSGSGWYHAPEVAAARSIFGSAIRVSEGHVLVTANDNSPFSWIGPLFKQRAKWQQEKNPAQKPLKLGLNSLYGKLAQGVGYNGRPRWQSYFWAGEITARTRARLFSLAAKSTRPIMLATDGLYCSNAHPETETGLGSWELGAFDWLFAAQPGVYHAFTDGVELVKSRGFFAKEVDYEAMRETWLADGADGVYQYESTRFIGLGSALHRKRLDIWRQWVPEKRSLFLRIDRKILADDGMTLLPPSIHVDSEPYVPKQSLVEARELDNIQGMEQPLRQEM